MRKTLQDIILPQLDELISKYNDIKSRSRYDDNLSDIPEEDMSEFVSGGFALINRVFGSNSAFELHLKNSLEQIQVDLFGRKANRLAGALKALRTNIASGYLESVQERIHADMFADFLEMADYLLNDGFKDPAAVLVGGVLEEHLRKLCVKNSISLEYTDAKGMNRPKKAENMNTDLVAKGVYEKLDQKNVTAWLDLRNKAAHAKYADYDKKQVDFMLHQVRDFIIRYPA